MAFNQLGKVDLLVFFLFQGPDAFMAEGSTQALLESKSKLKKHKLSVRNGLFCIRLSCSSKKKMDTIQVS